MTRTLLSLVVSLSIGTRTGTASQSMLNRLSQLGSISIHLVLAVAMIVCSHVKELTGNFRLEIFTL